MAGARWRRLKGGRGVDADQTLRGAVQGNHLGPCQAQFIKDTSGAFGKGLAGGSGAHLVGAALEQRAAERLLQTVDTSSHRRGCQLPASCSGGEAAALQHIEEKL